MDGRWKWWIIISIHSFKRGSSQQVVTWIVLHKVFLPMNVPASFQERTKNCGRSFEWGVSYRAHRYSPGVYWPRAIFRSGNIWKPWKRSLLRRIAYIFPELKQWMKRRIGSFLCSDIIIPRLCTYCYYATNWAIYPSVSPSGKSGEIGAPVSVRRVRLLRIVVDFVWASIQRTNIWGVYSKKYGMCMYMLCAVLKLSQFHRNLSQTKINALHWSISKVPNIPYTQIFLLDLNLSPSSSRKIFVHRNSETTWVKNSIIVSTEECYFVTSPLCSREFFELLIWPLMSGGWKSIETFI